MRSRYHDGDYARLAVGSGAVIDSVEVNRGSKPASSAGFYGEGASFECALGKALFPGFVLGGGVSLETGRVVESQHFQDDGYLYFSIGPIIDIFPSPAAGFHVTAGAGISVTDGTEAFEESTGQATGYALHLGIGNDWWIDDETTLGFLFRVRHIQAWSDNGYPAYWQFKSHHAAITAGVMFSVAYN